MRESEEGITNIFQRFRRRNQKYISENTYGEGITNTYTRISENQEKESQIHIRDSGEGITYIYYIHIR